MVQFNIKEFDLRFIIDKDIKLTHYVNVSLTSTPPIKKDDFYWIDSINHDSLGFMYGLYGIDEKFNIGGLYPLLPVIVFRDVLNIHDIFYNDGIIGEVNGLYLDNSDRWVIIDEFGNECYESEVYKVIATPEQIGWVYNEGPPHDHNYNFVDSRFLEDVHPRVFIDCVKNDFKVTIVVDETCIPKSDECRGESMLIPHLHDGKVIIDGYGLLKNSSSIFVY